MNKATIEPVKRTTEVTVIRVESDEDFMFSGFIADDPKEREA